MRIWKFLREPLSLGPTSMIWVGRSYMSAPGLGLPHYPLAYFPFCTQGVFPSLFYAFCAGNTFPVVKLFKFWDIPSGPDYFSVWESSLPFSSSCEAASSFPYFPLPPTSTEQSKHAWGGQLLWGTALITKVSSLICLRSGFQNQHVNKKYIFWSQSTVSPCTLFSDTFPQWGIVCPYLYMPCYMTLYGDIPHSFS